MTVEEVLMEKEKKEKLEKFEKIEKNQKNNPHQNSPSKRLQDEEDFLFAQKLQLQEEEDLKKKDNNKLSI